MEKPENLERTRAVPTKTQDDIDMIQHVVDTFKLDIESVIEDWVECEYQCFQHGIKLTKDVFVGWMLFALY